MKTLENTPWLESSHNMSWWFDGGNQFVCRGVCLKWITVLSLDYHTTIAKCIVIRMQTLFLWRIQIPFFVLYWVSLVKQCSSQIRRNGLNLYCSWSWKIPLLNENLSSCLKFISPCICFFRFPNYTCRSVIPILKLPPVSICHSPQSQFQAYKDI